jgi:CRP-like cAMP-binding protein
MNADANFLSGPRGFSWLAQSQREALASKLRVLALKNRGRISVGGESAHQVYLVLRGLVQVGEPDYSVTSIVGPGEIFGFAGLILDQPGFFFYRALSEAYIGITSADDFMAAIFGISPENIGLLLDFVVKKWWGGAILRMFHSNHLSVEHRVNHALRDLGAKIGVKDSRGTILNVPITHEALAELVGASRPKVTEALRNLTRAGKIVRDRRRLILVDQRSGQAREPQLRSQIR